ncbi:hypothetical protein AVEN_136183-1 [Araneus ventricosus]|uniref:Uncharacterized protein n=1 Tax=Araneus ventricosus TaxID=182803 RepID=A0A4Y2RBN8_ARAVE|nr:hypothetical protein AVEN_136183-1 [Araneus ventricosus]
MLPAESNKEPNSSWTEEKTLVFGRLTPLLPVRLHRTPHFVKLPTCVKLTALLCIIEPPFLRRVFAGRGIKQQIFYGYIIPLPFIISVSFCLARGTVLFDLLMPFMAHKLSHFFLVVA